MCGVPHHAFDGYLGKLARGRASGSRSPSRWRTRPRPRGWCDARSSAPTPPAPSRPATELLGGRAVLPGRLRGGRRQPRPGLAGGLHRHLRGDALRRRREPIAEQLAHLRPREVLVAEGWDGWLGLWPRDLPPPTLTPLPATTFSPSAGEQRLRRVLAVGSLRGFGLDPGRAPRRHGRRAPRLRREHPARQSRAPAPLRAPAAGRRAGPRPPPPSATSRSSGAATAPAHGSLVGGSGPHRHQDGSRLLRDWLRPAERRPRDHRRPSPCGRGAGGRPRPPPADARTRCAISRTSSVSRVASGCGQAEPRELHALRAGVDRLPAVTAALAGASSPLLQPPRGRLRPPRGPRRHPPPSPRGGPGGPGRSAG